MIEDLFDVQFTSNQQPLLFGLIFCLLKLVRELYQIIVTGVAVDMLFMLSDQAVPDPIGLIQIPIVAQAIVAEKGFVDLLDQQVITGRLSIHNEPKKIRAASGQTRAPIKVISQGLGQQPAITRLENQIDD